jgi:hypothetical protein
MLFCPTGTRNRFISIPPFATQTITTTLSGDVTPTGWGGGMDFTYWFPWKYLGVRFQGAGLSLSTGTFTVTENLNGVRQASRTGSVSTSAGVITSDLMLRTRLPYRRIYEYHKENQDKPPKPIATEPRWRPLNAHACCGAFESALISKVVANSYCFSFPSMALLTRACNSCVRASMKESFCCLDLIASRVFNQARSSSTSDFWSSGDRRERSVR